MGASSPAARSAAHWSGSSDRRGVDLSLPCQGPALLREIPRLTENDPRPLLAEADVLGSVSGDEHLAGELEAALAALEDGPREAAIALTAADARQVA